MLPGVGVIVLVVGVILAVLGSMDVPSVVDATTTNQIKSFEIKADPDDRRVFIEEM